MRAEIDVEWEGKNITKDVVSTIASIGNVEIGAKEYHSGRYMRTANRPENPLVVRIHLERNGLKASREDQI